MNTKNTTLDPLDLYDVRSELSDDERMVQDTVARFVDDAVIPLMREAFEQHSFPMELVPQVAELGLFGSSIDGYDCAGLNSVSYGLICQELERGDSGLRSFASVQGSLVMWPISVYGSEEQRQRYLPELAAGTPATLALMEPHADWDPGHIECRAERRGESLALGGTKTLVVDGQAAQWIVASVSLDGSFCAARTRPKPAAMPDAVPPLEPAGPVSQ